MEELTKVDANAAGIAAIFSFWTIFYDPMGLLFTVVVIASIIDFIVGVISMFFEKEQFSRKKMIKGIAFIICCGLLISIFRLIDILELIGGLSMANWITGMIALYFALNVVKNITKISGSKFIQNAVKKKIGDISELSKEEVEE